MRSQKMKRRLIRFAVIAALAGAALGLAACDNSLLATIQARVGEFRAAPDEIVVNLTYGGPYELSAQMPLWMVMLPHPWDGIGSDELPYERKVDAPGRIAFNVADLPSENAEDGTYFLVMVHDFSGDYENFYDGSTLDTSGLYSGAGDGNFTTDFSEIVVTYPTEEDPTTPYTVNEAAQLAPGNIYSVTYTDEPLIEADAYEDDPDFDSPNVPTASFATVYSRTIGFDDEDWFKFTVPDNNTLYRVVVAENLSAAYDESTLFLGIPVELNVFSYDVHTAGLGHIGSDYDDADRDDDNYGLVDAVLNTGYTYYARISSTERTDVGEYLFAVIEPTPP